jgi:hypothetical protein
MTTQPTFIAPDSGAPAADPVATFAESAGRDIRTGTIYARECEIDPDIQRPEQLGLINKIAKNLRPRALGVLTISVREEVDAEGKAIERYIVLDGQQRMRGTIKADYDKPLRAQFLYGLTREEEAELFRLLNDRLGVGVKYLYHVGLTEKRPDVIGIQRILDDLGIPTGPRGFEAYSVALRLARLPEGLPALRWALEVMKEAYGHEGDTKIYDYRVVEALSLLKVRDGKKIKTPDLVNKLIKEGGGIARVIGNGKTWQLANKSRLLPGVFTAIVRIYNTGLHKDGPHILEDWTPRAEWSRAGK